MKQTGYIRDNGTNPEGIERRKKLLIKAGCEDVIVERVDSLEEETPELDRYLENAGEGDCLMTVNMASLSRNMVTCARVIQSLAMKNAKFSMLDKGFDLTSADDQFILNIQAAREEYADRLEQKSDL